MMDPAVRQRRHAQLWETADTNARRIAIGGVIFAVVILFNVIEPHFRNEQQKGQLPEWRAELIASQEKQAALKQRKADLEAVAATLEAIKRNVENAPWQTDIQALIKTCARGCPADVQARADNTIRSIAKKMREISVEPLRAKMQETNLQSDLQDSLDSIKKSIDDWEKQRIGKVWYGTLRAKEATAAVVGSNVRARAEDAENTVGVLDTSTTGEIVGLAGALAAKQKAIAASQKENDDKIKENEAKIAGAMQAALPGWATGLITVKNMVVLYPWILALLGIFTVGYGLLAGRHYRAMADAEGWTADERGDPVLSSPWTLTWRGYAGGVTTLLLYGGVLLALGYCLLRSTQAADAETVANESAFSVNINLPTELAFAVLVIALLLAGLSLRRRS